MNSEEPAGAIRNISFNAVRVLLPFCVSLVTSAVIARWLGPDNLGQYSYVTWLAGVLAMLTTLGFPLTLSKYTSEFLGRGEPAIAAGFALRLLRWQFTFGIALATAALLARTVFTFSIPPRLFFIAVLIMLGTALYSSAVGLLSGMQRFDRLAVITTAGAVVDLVLVILVAVGGGGVGPMLMVVVAGLGFRLWMSGRLSADLLKHSSPSRHNVELFRNVRSFAVTGSYIVLISYIVWQPSEIFFLKRYSRISELAIYAVAFALAARLGQIGEIISGVFLPFFSSGYGRSGRDEIGLPFQNALKYLQIILVPLCGLGIIVARPVIGLVYGGQYVAMAPVLQVLFVGLLITGTAPVCAAILYATEHQNFIRKAVPFIALLNIGLDFLLIPRAGALGAAVANATAQGTAMAVSLVYISKVLRAPLPWGSTALTYVAAIASLSPLAYGAWRGVHVSTLIILTLTAATLYVALQLLFRQISSSDLQVVRIAFQRRSAPDEVISQ